MAARARGLVSRRRLSSLWRSDISSHRSVSSGAAAIQRSFTRVAIDYRAPAALRAPPRFSYGHRRSLFIQVQTTPNPASLIFSPGKPVMEIGSSDFPNARTAMKSPLAKSLFGIDGVTRVFFGSDFVTVTKSDDTEWDVLKPEVFAAIMDFYASGQPLFYSAQAAAPKDTAIEEGDDETVVMIKELLETRIRPAVKDDGGDIEYRGFDRESGIVELKMQGACSGCPSSAVTLKSGIENMLMHYVPEVKGVKEVKDDDEEEKAEGA
ncbi:nifU-like protein 4, mitochondrial [Selaginella moellendorffii]|nr:nifU-like protein 4, mitochondrial [Selaginella moellendorffii]|eukprot:XP_002968155.2 nifU-like protein 4, mitochondrial [Selaginella moellendorffii]